ncbi:c-type cytochrome [Pacificoceanicola onchidii]|uniref:c-type cytochrome n=1 Tax=Pacificoceanicola onchidii TaxID=2562685 RepID=UPI0010A4656F|nr:c-type cytochrome [Pacificoceanicola onchidii]
MYRVILILAVFLAGCYPQEQAQEPTGRALYETHCATCHGVGGQGDGDLAGEFGVPVPNLTVLRESNGGVFPYEGVMAQVYGYPGRYHLGLMPEFGPDLEGAQVDLVTQTGQILRAPRALVALVDYIETLQQ